MNKKFSCLLIATLCLCLGACKSQTETVKVDCGDFTLSCPASWQVKTYKDASEGAPLAQIHMPDKDNRASNIFVYAHEAQNLKAEDFTAAYAQNLVDAAAAANKAELTLESCDHVVLGGRPAVSIRYSGMISGSKIIFTDQIIPLETKFYRITYTQLNENDASGLEAVMNTVNFR